MKSESQNQLLIIDDDQNLLHALKLYFEKHGYQVVTAEEGSEGLQRLFQTQPHVVILDIMMPGMDGWKVCERIREMTDIPIIMLTSRSIEADRIKGLKMGADDYVPKPFSIRELEARVEAVLRRWRLTRSRDENGVLYQDDYLVIDAEQAEVRCADQPVDLTPTEQKLLFYLAENRGRLLSFDQILASVWGFEYTGEKNYVRLYIWRLRQKIEPDPGKPRYILTEHGMGYRFVGL